MVFLSEAGNLVTNDSNGSALDLFRRDLESGVTEWISRIPSGVPPESTSDGSFSRDPVVSDDGSVVAFISDSVLIAPVEGYGTTVLVWNSGMVGLKRVRLPGPPSGLLTPLAVDQVVLSGDGRFLVFAVSPGPRVSGQSSGIWRLDVASGVVSRISEDRVVSVESHATGPSLSSDGLTVAFSVEPPTDTLGANRVLIWKEGLGLHTLEELRQTVPPVGGEPAQSTMPVLSPDGAGLVFVSDSAIPEAGVTTAGTA